MAKVNPLVLKVLFIGVPFLIGIAMLPTDQPAGGSQHPYRVSMPNSSNGVYSSDSDIASFGSIDGKAVSSFRPGYLPSSLTSGEEDWTYRGNVRQGGKRKALLQNTVTGESVYLEPGDRWKDLRLLSLKDNSILISDMSAMLKSFGLSSGSAGNSGSDSNMATPQ
ncbi:MAG: hypothetical protein GC165_13635 [Armatimonadetes bacterium]|nr:hypothetical protein [Armatimonadota bacterium]